MTWIPLPIDKWSFKQASKCAVDRDERKYGVFPLPTSIKLGDLTSSSEKDVERRELRDWLPVSSMPSDVHVELMRHGITQDPSLGMNEADVQWVGEVDWLYRCSFKSPEVEDGERVDLIFEGLDTCATLWINGQRCYESDNAFLRHRVPVSEFIKKSGPNELVIHFASAFMHGKDLEAEHGERSAWNGDKSRVYIRKPQYHYGWDWGPSLLTCGLKGTPALQVYKTCIKSVTLLPNVALREKSGTYVTDEPSLEVRVEVQSVEAGDEELRFEIPIEGPGLDSGVSLEHYKSQSADAGTEQHIYRLKEEDAAKVRLWWPVGYGEQTLYKLRIQQMRGNVLEDCIDRRIGFRSIELEQKVFKEAPGTSFFFRVNGVPIFMAGSNWIPADSFPSQMTAERYRAWLKLLVKGNQNAIRVWGGGYYESEAFYDICDELGVLVWQDFMFACAAYPADLASFRESVAKEAEQVTKRLGSRACLALFAGNNEDYQIAEAEQLGWDSEDQDPSSWLRTKFPARYLYEKALKEIVHTNTNVAYHPGSPWKTGPNTRDKTKGDQHEWSVWHGSQEDYQDWDKLGGRFVSEFGMHGYPDVRTVDHFLEYKQGDRYPQSRIVNMHNKADGGPERLEVYLIRNFKHNMDMPSYVFASQLMQAECLETAYSLWRREWRGKGKEYCGGALVWQLNDVYPCISWSIVDYFLRPKPAFYAIKRAIQPVSLGLKRTFQSEKPDPRSAETRKKCLVQAWASNLQLKTADYALVTEFFHVETGVCLDAMTRTVKLGANQTTELGVLPLSEWDEQKVVVASRLIDSTTGNVIARAHNWPQPYKYLQQPPFGVQMRYEGKLIKISVDRPLKGLIFSMPSSERVAMPEYTFSDNCFDMMPGDPREIEIEGYVEGGLRPYSRWYH